MTLESNLLLQMGGLSIVGKVLKWEELLVNLGFKVDSLLTTYLDMLLGATHNPIMCKTVEKKLWERMALWKIQFKSIGVRQTLSESNIHPPHLLHVLIHHTWEGGSILLGIQALDN